MNGNRPRKPNGRVPSSSRPKTKTAHGLGELGRLQGREPPRRCNASGSGGGRGDDAPAAPLRIPLPQRACDEVSRRWSAGHLGLAYDKFAFGWSEDWRLDPVDHKSPKREFLNRFVEAYNTSGHPARELYRRALTRRQALLGDFERQGFHVERCVARSAWRFVSGLGIAHPFEIGFVFDRLYGLPLLPGSSVKGAARAWAEQALTDADAVGAWSGKDRATLDAVFGPKLDEDGERAQAARGAVIFCDAWPVTGAGADAWPKLEVDLLNPHYKDYYDGKPNTAPADYLAPNPVFFLTVAAGQAYEFSVAVRSDAIGTAGAVTPAALARLALAAVLGAAGEAGLGGKTSVGYGYFERGLPETPSG